jgi:hypothetical protein
VQARAGDVDPQRPCVGMVPSPPRARPQPMGPGGVRSNTLSGPDP